ncbi:MAG: pagL [Gammaproteobacteria bacterium]|nr:pagL [Gammaproteobacteria bacterium]
MFYRLLALLLITLFSHIARAQIGIAFTYPLIDKDPSPLKGYRGALWYQPSCLAWEHIKIYFDMSLGHWWVSHYPANREINIYSLAPTLRYYFTQRYFISPYIDLSIGASYLTRTRFADRNLGIYFSFQDQLAVGASFGKEQKLSVSLSMLHYSNGSIAGTNAGITIPLLINMGYGF